MRVCWHQITGSGSHGSVTGGDLQLAAACSPKFNRYKRALMTCRSLCRDASKWGVFQVRSRPC